MGGFCCCISIYIINLLTRAYRRLATELPCLCITSETASLSSGFFESYRFIQSSNLASRTTGVEDTYRTLTAIPFQLGVNNSLKTFACTGKQEKNLPSFRCCKIYNSSNNVSCLLRLRHDNTVSYC